MQVSKNPHPIVVIKLVVKEPSENRKRRQLFPTPAIVQIRRLNNRNKKDHITDTEHYKKQRDLITRGLTKTKTKKMITK